MAKMEIPERLRIAVLTTKFPMSGMANDYGYLWHLCRNMHLKGHDITVISGTNPGRLSSPQIIDGVKILFLDPQFGELQSQLSEAVLDPLEQLHHEDPFHIVHSADQIGKLVGTYKARLQTLLAVDIKATRLDQIFDILGLTEETVFSYLKSSLNIGKKFFQSYFGSERKLLKAADGIFVASGQQAEILERYYRIAASRVHLIPYGIDAGHFQPAPTKPEVLKLLDLDPETKLCVTVTPLDTSQELMNLLDAFEKVVIKKPKTNLIIVGSGPKKFQLESHMLDLALASKVHFIDQASQEQINVFINAADVFVSLKSRSTGFDPSVLEAMACCKMVIASEVGTASNVIRSGVDGFLLRPSEIGALSQLMLQGVSGQIDLLAMGEKARQKIVKMFDTDIMVDQTIKAYISIMKRSGKYK